MPGEPYTGAGASLGLWRAIHPELNLEVQNMLQ
jgi:hypothetical protein